MTAIEIRNTDGWVCEWFALCLEPVAYLVSHPVLGQVPTCQRCAVRSGHVPSEGKGQSEGQGGGQHV